MAIILRKNQYRGVNAHLHSYLQNEAGGWKVFHNKHMSDLAEAIDTQLPPGYEVGMTKSLQISEYHPHTGEKIRKRPEPDVTIYDLNAEARQSGNSSGNEPMSALIEVPVIETIEEDDELFLTALVIYEIEPDESRKPVTRIELLSPSNKPPGEDFIQYRDKRNATLRQGTPLIEIDYLHETHPVTRRIPSYRDKQPGATPYSIIVSDPRPSLEEGRTRIYGFRVDEPIPALSIPLSGKETLRFDFDAVYQRTFESLSYFCNRADYEYEPVRFETYAADDQARIRARMEAVQRGAQHG